MELDAGVRAYYERGGELVRLDAGPGLLELLRTQDVLRRVLPPAPARVLDVGGGTGAHARWLVDDGYEVTLVDPVPLHVEHAGRLPGVDAVLGDARALDVPHESFDATLLLGPLYHLLERDERATALREAARVTRPGGLVVGATISRYAVLHDLLRNGRYLDPAVRRRVDSTLGDGANRPDQASSHKFTTAYFHHPDDVPAEFADAGLPDAQSYLVEGSGYLLANLDELLADEDGREALLHGLRLVEREPTLMGASAHLLTVARVLGGQAVTA